MTDLLSSPEFWNAVFFLGKILILGITVFVLSVFIAGAEGRE